MFYGCDVAPASDPVLHMRSDRRGRGCHLAVGGKEEGGECFRVRGASFCFHAVRLESAGRRGAVACDTSWVLTVVLTAICAPSEFYCLDFFFMVVSSMMSSHKKLTEGCEACFWISACQVAETESANNSQ